MSAVSLDWLIAAISRSASALAPVISASLSRAMRQAVQAPTVSISLTPDKSTRANLSPVPRRRRSTMPTEATISGPVRAIVLAPPSSPGGKVGPIPASGAVHAGKSLRRQVPEERRAVATSPDRLRKAGAAGKGSAMTGQHNSTPLDKTFDPAAIEKKWYAHWEDKGLFRPERPDAQPFTIVNPPPNVTGSLHIGHALDNTLQDIVIRYERLRGKDALWVVGTDHAGIATQMVVERQLEARQDKRTNYSREAFIDKVWEWKRESGGTITRQLRRLGCSMDWSREQFTMDPHFTRAVVKVFVDLYNQGLIYRDKRLVNWDPKLKTAISDLEVETREVKGGFWHFRYPLADGVKLDNGADHIVVATTRPETMLADMAVAVNADDPRYRSVIGKEIEQPITGRRLSVVGRRACRSGNSARAR